MWIRILFGLADFEIGQGLYVPCSPGTRLVGPTGVEFAPIGQDGRLMGLLLYICGYELMLYMDVLCGKELLGRQVAYRPMEFHVRGEHYEKSVVMSWDLPGDDGTIHFSMPSTRLSPSARVPRDDLPK